MPLLGGVVWAIGNYCVFRASTLVGLARAAGTWTPLNIVVAFGWGAVLFGELDGFSAVRLALLGVAFLAVVAGVLLIAGARERPAERVAPVAGAGVGLVWAAAAGVLWGSYFVPAQWAQVPATVGNAALALGILGGALALALPSRHRLRLSAGATAAQLGAGVLFGVGNLALLGVVAQLGTGAGFTIAQLSLAVNAGIGIWLFHVPAPGTRQARTVLAGILVAGLGGAVIASLR